MKKNQKILKPIDLDLHFKYRCTNSKCELDHWISLKEAKTKNFKIVCDCGLVYRPKQISKIKIVYTNNSYKKVTKTLQPKETTQKINVPEELKNSCSVLLCQYGFTSSESIALIEKAFEKNPTEDAGSLIKYIITNLEILNVNS